MSKKSKESTESKKVYALLGEGDPRNTNKSEQNIESEEVKELLDDDDIWGTYTSDVRDKKNSKS